MNRLVWLAPLLLLIAFGVIAAIRLILGPGADEPVFREQLDPRPAPAISFPPLREGAEPVIFAQNREGPVAVNLFASWCTPCIAEHPRLIELSETEGVRLIGVLYKDSDAAGEAFLSRLGDPYETIVTDRDGSGGLDFGITGVPETFIIDAEGRIVQHYRGPLDDADVAELKAFFAGNQKR